MRGMNRVTLVGNLGKDPEIKTLADGVVVAKMAVATTEIYRAKDGSSQSNTQWHNVILWRGLAVLAEQYLKKGSLVFLEGKLRYRKFDDKEGHSRSVTEILANQLIMLDKRAVVTKPETLTFPEGDQSFPF